MNQQVILIHSETSNSGKSLFPLGLKVSGKKVLLGPRK